MVICIGDKIKKKKNEVNIEQTNIKIKQKISENKL